MRHNEDVVALPRAAPSGLPSLLLAVSRSFCAWPGYAHNPWAESLAEADRVRVMSEVGLRASSSIEVGIAASRGPKSVLNQKCGPDAAGGEFPHQFRREVVPSRLHGE